MLSGFDQEFFGNLSFRTGADVQSAADHVSNISSNIIILFFQPKEVNSLMRELPPLGYRMQFSLNLFTKELRDFWQDSKWIDIGFLLSLRTTRCEIT
jgi:hypothetical protein